MKKGQSKAIIILLIVIAVVLIVIAFRLFAPSITGNVVNQNSQSTTTPEPSNSNQNQQYPPLSVMVGVKDINDYYGLSPTPITIRKVNVKRNNEGNYDGVSFSLHSDNREDINCYIQEYYDSIFNSAFDEQLRWGSGTPIFKLNFESAIKPKVAKYDIDCIGEKSGFENKKSLILNIIYPEEQI